MSKYCFRVVQKIPNVNYTQKVNISMCPHAYREEKKGRLICWYSLVISAAWGTEAGGFLA